MSYQREFVCYTDPSQFQDEHHRKQVKSYASSRALWVEKRLRLDIKRPSGRFSWNAEANTANKAPDPVSVQEKDCSLTFINRQSNKRQCERRPLITCLPVDAQSGKLRRRPPSCPITPGFACSCDTRSTKQERLLKAAIAGREDEDEIPKGDCTLANRLERHRLSMIKVITSPAATIDSVPGLPHRQSQGFATASDFCMQKCG